MQFCRTSSKFWNCEGNFRIAPPTLLYFKKTQSLDCVWFLRQAVAAARPSWMAPWTPCALWSRTGWAANLAALATANRWESLARLVAASCFRRRYFKLKKKGPYCPDYKPLFSPHVLNHSGYTAVRLFCFIFFTCQRALSHNGQKPDSLKFRWKEGNARILSLCAARDYGSQFSAWLVLVGHHKGGSHSVQGKPG